ncbi:MAG: hypothetical protein V1822_02655, partial [Candidatus Micrarchaeota archaeon]
MSEEKKGDNGMLAAAAVVLCILLFAGGYYWFVAAGQGASAPGNEGQQTLTLEQRIAADPSASAMFEALGKQSNFPQAYYAAYDETGDGVPAQHIAIYKGSKLSYVSVGNDLFEQEAYWNENGSYVCQSGYNRSLLCGPANGSAAINVSDALDQLFIGYEPSAKAQNEQLYGLGVINFTAPPRSRSIAGRQCTQVEYKIDYSRLSDAQLAQLGVAKDDPVLTVFDNFTMQRCFDDEYGITIYSNLTYETYLAAGTLSHAIEYSEFDPAPTEGGREVEINANGTQLDALMAKMEAVSQAVDDCMGSGGNISTCILADAIKNEDVQECALINDAPSRDNCAMRIVLQQDDANLCVKTGSLHDECYLNYAYINSDTSYCTLINDKNVSRECFSAVSNQAKSDSARTSQGSGANGSLPAAGEMGTGGMVQGNGSAGQGAVDLPDVVDEAGNGSAS